MSIRRGSVLGLVLCLVLVGTIKAQAQGNRGKTTTTKTTTTKTTSPKTTSPKTTSPKITSPVTTSLEPLDGGGLSALRTVVNALLAQLDQSNQKISQLEAALNAEISARQAADGVLQNNINAMSGGGVTQAALDAAIAAEASARSAADATFAPLSSVSALSALVPLAAHVTVAAGDINGLAGPHVIFNGANVHIRSGHASGNSLVQNGLGNLIVGYNEPDGSVPAERGGSHNVVAGPYHRYNFGVGLVVGYASRLGGDGASVSGGFVNTALGEFSSVSGGSNNAATGMFAAVSGGDNNTASGDNASISAGQLNQASGGLSSVSGGFMNQATATASTVGGGAFNANALPNSFVP